MTNREIPEGYMEDAQGRLVPVEMVKDIDRERDALVHEIATKAKGLAETMREFKGRTMDDIQAFIDLSAERFGTNIGGIKGNISLRSYDGRFRVQRDMDEYLVFDERLQVAKALIDECIHKWAAGTTAEIRALINDAFQVDKRGRVNTKRILSLRRINIDDPTWKRAMEAISESVQVAGSRAYIRVYERQEDGEYRQINLDLAAA
jgi:hypothetical protein